MITGVQNLPPVEIGKIGDLRTANTELNGVETLSVGSPLSSGEHTKRNSTSSPSELRGDKVGGQNFSEKAPNYNALASKLNGILNDKDVNLEFSYNKDMKKMILKLIDSKTNEVVEQFPSEISVKIAKIISKSIESGSLADAKV
ncbi:MAG: flagellar protein FlaG [Candidatus Kapabacteria bacterium]|nr:flagellar protein FlaG [Candidatus Kapabacteria bacterium]